MVRKDSGFNLSVAASRICAQALRFPGSISTMRDGKLVQMLHSCYHVETICHPNSSYVTTKLYGGRLPVDATIIRYFQKELF